MHEIYEHGDAPPGLTLVVVLAITVALGWFAIVLFMRARGRSVLAAEEAASLRDPTLPLHEGEVVLSGVVEHAEDCDVAVRVEITQDGTESESSGSWSYSWTEVDRQVKVAPFYLKLPDATRIRVEPPRDVDVADDLDGKVLINQTRRIRSAELIPGESLHAHGWLERGGDATAAGYRDVTWGWLLRPANGRMMLSSLPLGDGLRKRAAFHRGYGWFAIVAFLAFHISAIAYHARALGHVEEAQIVGSEHSTYKDSDGDIQHRYDLTIRMQDGSTHAVQISSDDHSSGLRGQPIPIRRGALGWALGSRPTLSYVHLAISTALCLLLFGFYQSRRVSTRPWFRRKVVDNGSGRLADSS